MKSILTGDRFVLEQGALRAELLTPWSSVYGRSRFAHSGFISGLWLGDVCFTQAEAGQSTQKSTGGIGLCSEYKCPDVEMDSAVGEEYLKIGVGVMTRTSDPWHLTDETLIEGLPTQLAAQSHTMSLWGLQEEVRLAEGPQLRNSGWHRELHPEQRPR